MILLLANNIEYLLLNKFSFTFIYKTFPYGRYNGKLIVNSKN